MTIKKKLYEFGHLFKSELYRSEEVADGMQSHLDGLQQFHDRALARLTQINRNRNLTAIGKQDAYKKLREELTKELGDIGKPLSGYAAQIEKLESNALPTRHPKDDAAYEFRQREIRDLLRGMDRTAAEAEFMSAAESGNAEVLAAVLYSPVKFSFVTEDLATEVLRQQWSREFPEDADKLADLKHARSELDSAIKSAEVDLARHGISVHGAGAEQEKAA